MLCRSPPGGGIRLRKPLAVGKWHVLPHLVLYAGGAVWKLLVHGRQCPERL